MTDQVSYSHNGGASSLSVLLCKCDKKGNMSPLCSWIISLSGVKCNAVVETNNWLLKLQPQNSLSSVRVNQKFLCFSGIWLFIEKKSLLIISGQMHCFHLCVWLLNHISCYHCHAVYAKLILYYMCLFQQKFCITEAKVPRLCVAQSDDSLVFVV